MVYGDENLTRGSPGLLDKKEEIGVSIDITAIFIVVSGLQSFAIMFTVAKMTFL